MANFRTRYRDSIMSAEVVAAVAESRIEEDIKIEEELKRRLCPVDEKYFYQAIHGLVKHRGEEIFTQPNAKEEIIKGYRVMLEPLSEWHPDYLHLEDAIKKVGRVFDDAEFRAQTLKTYHDIVEPAARRAYN